MRKMRFFSSYLLTKRQINRKINRRKEILSFTLKKGLVRQISYTCLLSYFPFFQFLNPSRKSSYEKATLTQRLHITYPTVSDA